MAKKTIHSISLRKLVANPDNPNKMSITKFVKLIRNIGKSGIYEPLLVRRCKKNTRYYELINGYHRCRALFKLGHKNADCVLFDVDDKQTNILMATLNRLGGQDDVGKRIDLLKSLIKKATPEGLAKILPCTPAQIKKLTELKMPTAPAKMKAKYLFNAIVFFVTDEEKKIIEKAISKLAEQVKGEKTKTAKRSAALMILIEYFIKHTKK